MVSFLFFIQILRERYVSQATVDNLNRRRTASAASDFEIMFLCDSVRIFAICMRRYNHHFITQPKSANNLWLIDAHTWRDNTSQAGR